MTGEKRANNFRKERINKMKADELENSFKKAVREAFISAEKDRFPRQKRSG
jgi:hypothetical protein